jgi:hypothetical protein
MLKIALLHYLVSFSKHNISFNGWDKTKLFFDSYSSLTVSIVLISKSKNSRGISHSWYESFLLGGGRSPTPVIKEEPADKLPVTEWENSAIKWEKNRLLQNAPWPDIKTRLCQQTFFYPDDFLSVRVRETSCCFDYVDYKMCTLHCRESWYIESGGLQEMMQS